MVRILLGWGGLRSCGSTLQANDLKTEPVLLVQANLPVEVTTNTKRNQHKKNPEPRKSTYVNHSMGADGP